MNVDIVSIENKRVATTRHIGPYHQIAKAFETLGAIAGPAASDKHASSSAGFAKRNFTPRVGGLRPRAASARVSTASRASRAEARARFASGEAGQSPGRGGARTGRARRVSFRGEVAGGEIGRVTHRLGGDRLRARGERLDGLARGLVLEVELRAGDRGLGGESLLGSDSGHRVCEGTVVELGVRKE